MLRVLRRQTGAPRGDRPDDEGAALIVVVITMVILTITAVVLAGIVTSTTGMLVRNRSTAESRAAADAGLADAIALARKTSDPCTVSVPDSTDPKYEVTVECPTASQVIFTSTGHGPAAETKTQAVYNIVMVPVAGPGAEIVSFSTNDFQLTNRAVFTSGPDGATFMFPGGGDVTSCQTTIPATVLTKGSFTMDGNCQIEGNIHTGGDFTMRRDASVVPNADAAGNVKVAGADVNIDSRIGGIAGQLTLNPTATLNLGNVTQHAKIFGGQPGGIVRATVAPPTFDSWFDYVYSPVDWPGYTTVTVTPTSTPTCADIQKSSTKFWTTELTSRSAAGDLTLDLRQCGRVTLDSVANKDAVDRVARLSNDLLILTEGIRLSHREFEPADPSNVPNAWIVVEDKVANDNPTCARTAPLGVIDTGAQDTKMNVRTMAYTPCNVIFANGGGASWTGSVYSGQLTIEGSINVTLQPLALPGQWVGEGGGGGGGGSVPAGLGAIVSQRDIP